jgi:hypothetical protein
MTGRNAARTRPPPSVSTRYVVAQQRLEPIEVAAGRGRQQPPGQVHVRLPTGLEAPPLLAQVGEGAAVQLTAVGGSQVQHAGQLVVGVVEDAPQDEHRPLGWAESLQQEQHRKRHRLPPFNSLQRLRGPRTGQDRLG